MAVAVTAHKSTNVGSKPIRQWDPQAAGNSGVIVVGPRMLLGAFVSLAAAGPNNLWLQFFDSATVPAPGTAPKIAPVAINPLGPFNTDFITNVGHGLVCGVYFVNGICWAASTTFATLTADTSGVTWPTVRYI